MPAICPFLLTRMCTRSTLYLRKQERDNNERNKLLLIFYRFFESNTIMIVMGIIFWGCFSYGWDFIFIIVGAIMKLFVIPGMRKESGSLTAISQNVTDGVRTGLSIIIIISGIKGCRKI